MEEWHARKDSNPRLSGPKSEGARPTDLMQLLLARGACAQRAMTAEERHVVQRVVLALEDPDLTALLASWKGLPEHVRAAVRTLLCGVLRGDSSWP